MGGRRRKREGQEEEGKEEGRELLSFGHRVGPPPTPSRLTQTGPGEEPSEAGGLGGRRGRQQGHVAGVGRGWVRGKARGFGGDKEAGGVRVGGKG